MRELRRGQHFEKEGIADLMLVRHGPEAHFIEALADWRGVEIACAVCDVEFHPVSHARWRDDGKLASATRILGGA